MRAGIVRGLLAAVTTVVLASGCSGGGPDGEAGARADAPVGAGSGGPIKMVPTTEKGWEPVAEALGRPGKLSADGTVYRVGFPRSDLKVRSKRVRIKAGFALGSYAAFARYEDGRTMVMGDLVVTEPELPKVTDALQKHRVAQTAVHKHLLAHRPDVWWTHFHAVGKDPVQLAESIAASLSKTGTPPPSPPTNPPVDLDTEKIDKALGTKGKSEGGIYKFSVARDHPVAVGDREVNAAIGVSTALNFQPTGRRGDGKAAINGDFVMTAGEVNKVISALRSGGIDIVEVHNHALADDPRLFYMHFWGNADGVELATTLRKALDATAVKPG